MLLVVVGAPTTASAQTTYFVQTGLPFLVDVVPVSISGGDAATGGSATANATLGAEAHATAPAPNVLTQTTAFFPAHSAGRYTDIIISGPTPTVTVTLHVPFHANFIDHWSTWGGNLTFHSFSSHSAQFLATLIGPTIFEQGWFDVDTFNRAEGVEDIRIPVQTSGAAIDHTLAQTFLRVTPVTSDPTVGAFAGSQIDETTELRGEIALTGTVQTGVPLELDLDLQVNASALSFFIADARSVTDGRDTLGVPQGGVPVFDLPAGYTANSVSLGIVNNVVPGDGGVPAPKCPKPQGDWKNTPAAWPIDVLSLASQTYSKSELLSILTTPVGTGSNADASLILADQLIAAKLNVANGSDPSIGASIAAADSLLAGLVGRLGYRIKPSSALGKQMTATAATLESYNKKELTPICTP